LLALQLGFVTDRLPIDDRGPNQAVFIKMGNPIEHKIIPTTEFI